MSGGLYDSGYVGYVLGTDDLLLGSPAAGLDRERVCSGPHAYKNCSRLSVPKHNLH